MKINLKIKRNTKEISVRDIPVYSGSSIVSFKKFLVSSENGEYDDAIMTVYTTDSDALVLKKLGYAIIEKSFNDVVIYRVKLGIHDVINGRVFLRYPFIDRRFYVESSTDYVTEEGKHYYRVLLNGKHGIAKGDYNSCGYASITILNSDGDELAEVTDWFVEEEEYDKIYINTSSISVPDKGYYIIFNFDPVIYNDAKDTEGEELYPGDWHFYSEENESVKTRFIYDNPTINVPIGISSDTDYIGLRQNENVDDYYKKLTKGIVPDFINTEKTKYIPYIYSGTSKNDAGFDVDKLNGPASKIEFYLHFRNRAKEVVTHDINGEKVYGDMPSESWSVETEDTLSIKDGETLKFWNNFTNYSDIKEGNENLHIGDLIGNLGFTDDDVLNRKKKIKQSFIRLSFYSSNNPLQTSMLFTSTIFFDVNKLYSKYIKIYTSKDYDAIMSDYSKSEERGDSYDNHWGLVLFNGTPGKNSDYSYEVSELLTAELDVTSENERSSSAEGFNLYLFSDDSPKANEERTIYMKVEFNHAGYGRKFPMILWPTKDGVPVPLTRENFYEYLYIPVVVSYDSKSNKYYYYIKGAKNDTENNVIKLALFEPKVEPL